ncbi:MAG: hypothetical protein WC334_05345 [Kiritimatiellales bacterium]
MKTILGLCGVFLAVCLNLTAAESDQLIFQDDFQRNEPQEKTDEPGNGWGTNSKSRAKNNKQVDLRDGAMYIYISKEADHAVSVTHPAEFTDGTVALRFKLDDGKDSLGLDFADLECKTVHAGHLFVAVINPKQVTLRDAKTGVMNLETYDARKAKTLSKAKEMALKDKEKIFPCPLETGRWHDLLVTVDGDKLSASIGGRPVGSFKSEGIAHPTKRVLRLAVPRNAAVDDIKIRRKD